MLDIISLLGCLEKSDPSAKISIQEKRNVNQTPRDAALAKLMIATRHLKIHCVMVTNNLWVFDVEMESVGAMS